MVKFKFTKTNEVASIGSIKKLPIQLATTYEKFGFGVIVKEDTKKKTTKK